MRHIFGFLFFMVLVSACKKNNTCTFDPCGFVAPSGEIQNVESYLASNNITNATKHCSGLYYQIVSPGTGKVPDACSSVNVTYVGRQTNGATFDSGNNVTFNLSGLITAWQIGIPLLNEGGKIRLFIPPSLGYGSRQNGTLPPNSILIFDITLNAVN